MSDLIDRQAVIDAALKMFNAWYGRSLKRDDEIRARFSVLPSAQPEIIRCRDCKHFEYDHPYVIQGVPVLGHLVCNRWGDGCKTDEDGFCFMGERREDE